MLNAIQKTIFLAIALLGLNANSNAQFTLLDSLKAYYPFNGNANDESGNGNDAVVDGATLTTDRFGNDTSAYEFDGFNDWINTKKIFDYKYRTLSVWAKAYDIKGTGPNENIVVSQNSNGLKYGLIKLVFGNSKLYLKAGGETNFHTYLSPIDSSWYHFVLIRDGSQTIYYINNVMIGTNNSGTVGSISYPNDTLIIGMGRRIILGMFNGAFDGKIDDIRIYNRALNPREVDMLYHEGNCTQFIYDTITTYDTITFYDTTYITVTDTLLIDIEVGLAPPLDVNTIKVFPNPSLSHITIDNGDYANMVGYSIEITNNLSQQVFQSAITQQQFYIDLSTWGGPGLYFLSVIDPSSNIVTTRKIVLQ
jgi:Concanavalin A-like lectin/glucanases superfamily/Secretion system C-terminal sorting domain